MRNFSDESFLLFFANQYPEEFRAIAGEFHEFYQPSGINAPKKRKKRATHSGQRPSGPRRRHLTATAGTGQESVKEGRSHKRSEEAKHDPATHGEIGHRESAGIQGKEHYDPKTDTVESKAWLNPKRKRGGQSSEFHEFESRRDRNVWRESATYLDSVRRGKQGTGKLPEVFGKARGDMVKSRREAGLGTKSSARPSARLIRKRAEEADLLPNIGSQSSEFSELSGGRERRTAAWQRLSKRGQARLHAKAVQEGLIGKKALRKAEKTKGGQASEFSDYEFSGKGSRGKAGSLKRLIHARTSARIAGNPIDDSKAGLNTVGEARQNRDPGNTGNRGQHWVGRGHLNGEFSDDSWMGAFLPEAPKKWRLHEFKKKRKLALGRKMMKFKEGYNA